MHAVNASLVRARSSRIAESMGGISLDDRCRARSTRISDAIVRGGVVVVVVATDAADDVGADGSADDPLDVPADDPLMMRAIINAGMARTR